MYCKSHPDIQKGEGILKILFISLGCDKNLVDSEVMLGLLTQAGYEMTDEEDAADIAVVNSCCFIGDAKEESIETIIGLGELKKKGRLKLIVVCGCLGQRYEKEIKEELPEVDVIIGTTAYEDIVEAIEGALGGKSKNYFRPLDYLPECHYKKVSVTGTYFSYLKIAEGCNKNCTYCIIPKVRGKYRSYPMEEILSTAVELVRNGAVELILVAQETTLYGEDLYGRKMLPELLKKLCTIEELKWIRILYCYPEEITRELLETIKEEDKICNYLDIPIQHCSDSILRKMGRKTAKNELKEKISLIREILPDVALRTTLITGFPGEGEREHRELMDFVEEMKFERLGVFTYSSEEGTKAALMEDQVPDEVKEQRKEELMLLQQRIAYEKAEDSIGRGLKVMIEGRIPDEEGVYIGRTYMDAPQVDGYIFVNCRGNLMSGDFIEAEVTDAKGYDLIGNIIS